MKIKLSLVSSLLVLSLFGTACGGQPTGAASPPDSPLPQGGAAKDKTSLTAELQAAGATVETGDTIEQPFFTVNGQILKVNGADVQMFEYETAEAMEADAAQVASDGGSIGTSMVTWMATPHFFKSGRVLALYVGDDGAILKLLENVLGSQFAGR